LHLAASEGKMEAVEFLLKLKCNIACKDRYERALATSPGLLPTPTIEPDFYAPARTGNSLQIKAYEFLVIFCEDARREVGGEGEFNDNVLMIPTGSGAHHLTT
jgi:hypothetical protein